MGNLFRRVTLATLGLDSLDGVSEQSFDVIDKADAFAARLMGGVSSVMPKLDSEQLGNKATVLADHIMEGMSGLNGPKNATDLGDWQYWLDAVLLTLFDEEDEEEEVSGSINKKSASLTRANRQVQLHTSQADVAKRIAALKSSGIKPAMLQTMPNKAKKALAQQLKNADSNNLTNDFVAKTLSSVLNAQTQKYNTSATERIFSSNSRQTLASHIMNKASEVSFNMPASTIDAQKSNALTSHLTTQWSNAVQSLNSNPCMTTVKKMLDALDGLEKSGAVTPEQATSLRQAGRSYAKRVLTDEISHDASAVASRMEKMIGQSVLNHQNMISQRALSMTPDFQTSTSSDSTNAVLAKLTNHIADFTAAVSDRVLTEGESAATVRWSRAADRFMRLQGISDDVDRILLKDMAESAAALGNEGIIPQQIVNSINAVSHADVSNAPHRNASALFYGNTVASPRILGGLATRIEKSIDGLVHDLVQAGVAGSGVNTFISDIQQIVSTGNLSSSAANASSVIESICARLDEFADLAASSCITNGYDDITTEVVGTFVSATDGDAKDQADASYGNLSDRKFSDIALSSKSISDKTLSAVRNFQNSISIQQQQAIAKAQQIASEHASSLNAETQKLIASWLSASTIENLRDAHQALAPHLNDNVRNELANTIASVEKSNEQLEKVSQQIRLIEQTLNLSNGLRNAVRSHKDLNQIDVNRNAVSSSVVIDGMRIHGNYLSALSETLTSFAKIRDNYLTGQSVTGILSHNVSSMNPVADFNTVSTVSTENRLDKMLSIVKPDGIKSSATAENLMTNPLISTNEAFLGYDDIITSSPEWIHSAQDRYPSQDSMSDLSSILGSRRAAGLHASNVASGQTDQLSSLVSALSRLTSAQNFASDFSSYAVTNEGEQIKVSVNMRPKQEQGFSLRQNVGSAYQPSALRNTAVQPSRTASISVSHTANTVSGANQFVPVMAGANQDATYQNSNASQDMAQSHNALPSSSILAKLGLHATHAANEHADVNDDKFHLNIDGMDFEMNSDAFVQLVARPSMASAAASMPSLMNANNVLFAGYASLMNESGERRTLKSLRHAYIETLAKAGQNSAHNEIGFSTQSFTHFMEPVQTKSSRVTNDFQTTHADRFEQTASENVLDLSNDLVATKESIASSGNTNNVDFSWVSNQVKPHVATYSPEPSHISRSDENRQVLNRIDSMLDYVENMSERNIGVFSTDDTVRVLLETLPADAQLGNKGLPKWRHKDTQAARTAEARELREALAKIGASPVQGVQRFANKQFVSPNLFPNQASNAAPLFSGGDDGATAPRASANATNSGDSQFSSTSIQDEDLQFIAEEVFYRIGESLNEEYQRRRSE